MLAKLLNPKPAYQYYVAICCIVKDEHYLPEWIDYHLKISVQQFFIYDNGSATPVDVTLKSYIENGFVTVEHIAGEVQQMIAYAKCLKKHGPSCKWIAFIDADEFIVPKTFTGNLGEFLVPFEPFAGLGINWLMFGSNGHKEKPTPPQLESYTLRTPKTDPVNTHIKSIVQPRFIKPEVRSPHYFRYKRGKYSVNENFERFKGAFSPHSTNKIQLNHYWLRSESDFKEKLLRGRGDHNTPEYERKMENFYDTDKDATVFDDTILTLKMLMDKETPL